MCKNSLGKSPARLVWLAGLAWLVLGVPIKAAQANYDFNTTPQSEFAAYGSAQYFSSGGVGGTGFWRLTPPVNSSTGTLIFPDLTGESAVQAFRFSMDVRVGDGTDIPADGFSVNFARAGDPVIETGSGWADEVAEEGTTTGLSVCFDAYDNGNGDVVGIGIRVDGQWIAQFPVPTLNGACNDPSSAQTGLRSSQNPGSGAELCWQPFEVILAEDGTLDVYWKGALIVDNLQTGFFPSTGRFALGARTGGLNQITDIDNVEIFIGELKGPRLGRVSAHIRQVRFEIVDGSEVTLVENSLAIEINGQSVAPASVTKSEKTTTVLVELASMLASKASHTVRVRFRDSSGADADFSREFFTPPLWLVRSMKIGGGREELAQDIAVDAEGNAFVVGITTSEDFVTKNSARERVPGESHWDVFVGKVTPEGEVPFMVLLGGADHDYGEAIAVDGEGDVYVVIASPYSEVPPANEAFELGGHNVLLVKLSGETGEILYSLMIGGSRGAHPLDLLVDDAGRVIIVGRTQSADFPVTADAFQTELRGVGAGYLGDAFLAIVDPRGPGLIYATYLGGSQDDSAERLALAPDGSVWIQGSSSSSDFPVTADSFQPTYGGGLNDLFLARFSVETRALTYSSFLGGMARENLNWETGVGAVAVDANGAVLLAGATESEDFPLHGGQGAFGHPGQLFFAKLDPSGRELQFSIPVGGRESYQGATEIVLDRNGFIYLTGFSPTIDLLDEIPMPAGWHSGFVRKYDPDGRRLIYSTLLRGSSGSSAERVHGMAIGPDGLAWVAGVTASADFPEVEPNATVFHTDDFYHPANAFVAAIGAVDGQPPGIASVRTFGSLNHVFVEFTEAVDPITATEAGHYALSPAVEVFEAVFFQDSRTVRLRTADLDPDTIYALTVNGVRDLAWPEPNTVESASHQFSGRAGGILVKFFRNIAGTSRLDALTNDVRFPDAPDEVAVLDSFEVPANAGDFYGVQMQGFVIPPVTGDYIFYLASDDEGALFLSSDMDPGNKVLIAAEPVWWDARNWTGADSRRPNRENISSPVWLEAGRYYYIEALMAEGSGLDHVAVAWQPPGAGIPANGSPPISGGFLVPFAGAGPDASMGPITITAGPSGSVTVGELNDAEFRVTAEGGLPHFYQWYRDGEPIPGGTAPVLKLKEVALAADGAEISVTVSNYFSVTRSAQGVLSVEPDTSPPAVATVAGVDRHVAITFSEVVDPVTATDPANYQFSGIAVDTATASVPTVDPGAAGNRVLWLRADQGVETDGDGRVLKWADQSGQGNDFIEYNQRPLFRESIVNGWPAVKFGGDAGWLASELPVDFGSTNALLCFAIVRLDVPYRSHHIWEVHVEDPNGRTIESFHLEDAGSNKAWPRFLHSRQNPQGHWAESRASGRAAVSIGEFALAGFRLENGQMEFFLNGDRLAGDTSGLREIVGSGWMFLGNYNLEGSLAELVIYRGAMSDSEVEGILRHFSEKYGLAGTQPPIVLAEDRRTVMIRTTPQEQGQSYSVAVSGVKDASTAGNVMGAGNSERFGSLGFVPGHLLRELYARVESPYAGLGPLTNLSKFPDRPFDVSLVKEFRSPPENRDYYGARLTGLFLPPVTGDYVFHLRADDVSALFVSTDLQEAHKRLVVSGTSAAGGDWHIGLPRSAPLRMHADRPYYVEALLREYAGTDFLDVTWTLADGRPLEAKQPVIQWQELAAIGDPAGQSIVFTEQPFPAQAEANSRVAFSVAVQTSGEPVVYQWQRDGRDIPGATEPEYQTPFLSAVDDGARYRCRVGIPGLSEFSQEALVTVVGDASSPRLVSARGTRHLDGVELEFSEPIEWSTLTDLGNYSIAEGLDVLAVRADGREPHRVTLRTAVQNSGTAYTVRVTGVKDVAGRTIQPAHEEALFTSWAQSVQPGLFLEVLRDSGLSLEYFINNPGNSFDAGEVAVIGSFDTDGAAIGDNYLARISGYFVAPLDGGYRFFLATDDRGFLLLSTDDSRENKRIIVENGCCRGRIDQPGASARSEIVVLEAGGRYYIEGWLAQGNGDNFLQAAVRLPGENLDDEAGLIPIPVDWLETDITAAPEETQITFLAQPEGATVEENRSATFRIEAATSALRISYQWQRNGSDILGAIEPAYQTPALSMNDDGSSYRCVVRVPGGEAVSAEAMVTVIADVAAPELAAATRFMNQADAIVTFDGAVLPGEIEIVNPGFEADALRDWYWPGYVSDNGPITGWETTGTVGIGNPRQLSIGTVIDGSRALYLEWDASVSQTVAGFEVGAEYFVTYFEGMQCCTPRFLEVTAGGSIVVPAHRVPALAERERYYPVRSSTFIASAETIELVFQSMDDGSEWIFIDAVAIHRVGEPAGTNPDNYQWGGQSVAAALPTPNPNAVRVIPQGPVSSSPWIEVAGVADLAGNPMAARRSVAVETLPLAPLDVNNPNEVGYAYGYGRGEIDVIAGGRDIWDNNDQFQFVYESRARDFDVRVRVESLDRIDPWSKAGLMIRETLDPSSRTYNLLATPPTGAGLYQLDHRPRSGPEYNIIPWPEEDLHPGTVLYPNGWMRLKSAGGILTAYRSVNGWDWELLGSMMPNPPLPETVLLGLATTSHHNGWGQTVLARYRDYGPFSDAPLRVTELTNWIAGVSTPIVDGKVVEGDQVVFRVKAEGTGPWEFQWQLNGMDLADGNGVVGARLETLTLPAVRLDQEGGYSVTVWNDREAAQSDAAWITIIDPPGIVVPPLTQELLEGNSTVLTVGASGTPPLFYQWEKAGVGEVPGATGSFLSLNSVGPLDTGNYRVRVTNEGGSIASDYATVTVLWITNLVAVTPPSLRVVEGGTATFSAAASGFPAVSYQWFRDGALLEGAIHPSFLKNGVTALDTGAYTVRATNRAGVRISSSVPLEVILRPRILVQPQPPPLLAVGSTATLTVTASGTPPLTYQWLRNGSAVLGATEASLTLASVQLTTSGNYSVRVVNEAGSINSQGVAVTVLDPPAILVHPRSLTNFPGTTASFFVTASGSPPLGYRWFKDGEPLPSATGSALTLLNIQAANAGVYTVTVTNLVGSATSMEARLELIIAPQVTREPMSTNVVLGRPAELSVEVIGTEPLQYQWRFKGSDLAGATSRVLAFESVAQADEGDYSVRISNLAGFVNSAPARLTVLMPPSIVVPPAGVRAVLGTATNLSVVAQGTEPLAYQWMKNGQPLPGATGPLLAWAGVAISDGGLYVVAITNVAGAVTSAPPAELIVLVRPVITVEPASVVVTEGSSARFEVTASGSEPLSYQWFKGTEPLPGAVSRSLTLNSAGPAQSGFYHVVVSNEAGSVTSEEAELVVTTRPRIVTQPASQRVVAGTQAKFEVVAVGTVPLGYQWFYGSLLIPGMTDPILELQSVQSANEGSYRVRVFNDAGETNSEPATLTVLYLPEFTLEPVDQEVNQGETVEFAVAATGTEPLTYQWYFQGAPLAGETNQKLVRSNVQASATGEYHAEVKNEAGALNSRLARLRVIVPPPVNDLFADRILIEGTAVTVRQSNVSATVEPDEPAHAGVSRPDPGEGASIWWSWTAPADGIVRVRTEGSSLDTVLAVYRGTDLSTLVELAANDDLVTGTGFSAIELPVANGDVIEIAVDGFGGAEGEVVLTLELNRLPDVALTSPSAGATFAAPATILLTATANDADGEIRKVEFFRNGQSLAVVDAPPFALSLNNVPAGAYEFRAQATDDKGASRVSTPIEVTVFQPRPENDNLAARRVLTGRNVIVNGTNVAATREDAEPEHGGLIGGKSVWWEWTSPGPGVVMVGTMGSDFDTVLAVYSGGSLAAMAEIASDDESGGAGTSRLTFETEEGRTYAIAVDGYGGAAGRIQLRVTLNVRPTVSLLTPADGTVVQGPIDLSLGASADDIDGTVARVEFYEGGRRLGTATAQPYKFDWRGVAPGEYRLWARVVDNLGLASVSRTNSVEVTGAPEPPLFASPSPQTVVAGERAIFAVDATGTPPLSYRWFKNGEPIGGAVGSEYVIESVRTGDAGSYEVEVRNIAGAIRSDPALLTVRVAPVITLSPQNRNVPEGSDASFVVQAVGTEPLAYQWRFNGVPLGGETSRALLLKEVSAAQEGSYSVQVSNMAGTVESSIAILRVAAALALDEPPNLPRDDFWITDGPVRDIVETNGVVYLAGDFDYVGPNTGSAILIDSVEGRVVRSFPRFSGEIRAAVPDGQGGWFIGGSFNLAGGQSKTNLVWVRPDGTVDPAWSPNPDGGVRALALSGETLIVGGSFQVAGNRPRANLALLDARTGDVLDLAVAADGPVNALAVSGAGVLGGGSPVVFAGGEFLDFGGRARKRLAAIDLVTGAVTAWKPEANSSVFALAAEEGVIYAGGEFTLAGGQPRFRLAALDAADGTATAWRADADNAVRVLTLDGDRVLAGGFFNVVNGTIRNFVAALDRGTGAVLDWNPRANSAVWAIQPVNGAVFLGGQFTTVGDESRDRIALVNASSGVVQPLNPGANDRVFAITADQTRVLAGGRFNSAGGAERKFVAALDSATGTLTSWNPEANAPVQALAVAGRTVYLGGSFTHVGGQSRHYVAAIDMATGLARGWNPGADDFVYDLAVAGEQLFMAGPFLTVGGQPRAHLASAGLADGQVSQWNPGADGTVFALLAHGTEIYIGGDFLSVSGRGRERLAALDRTTGALSAWNPGAGGRVSALALLENPAAGNWVLVGGFFDQLGGRARQRFGAVDLFGDAVDWSPSVVNSTGLSSSINAVKVFGSAVYAGGLFNEAGGWPRRNLAGLSLTGPEATAWNPNADGLVLALAVREQTLYAGGNFAAIGGQVRPYFAAFTVLGTPIVTQQPEDRRTAAGATAELSVKVIGRTPLRYQWWKDGAEVAGQTSAVLAIPNASPAHSGTYWVRVSNALGEVQSAMVKLDVLNAPVIQAQPVSQQALPGEDVVFAVEAGGSAPLNYQWRKNGANLPGETGAVLALSNVQEGDAGSYQVVVGNAVGLAVSDRAFLQMQVSSVVSFTDAFASRARVTGLSSGTVAGSNSTATRDPQEPLHAGKAGEKSVWFSWVAPAAGIATVDTVGSDFDTLLAVYAGEVTGLSQLELVASDEDSGGFFASRASFNAVAGTEYHFVVDGFGGASGNIVLRWALEETEEDVPRIRRQPESHTVAPGGKVILNVSAESLRPLAYQWFHNGAPIEGATESTLVIPAVFQENVGIYAVEVSNPTRSLRSIQAIVELSINPGGGASSAITEDKMQDAANSPGLGGLALFAPRKTHFMPVTGGSSGTQILDNFAATKEQNEPNHAGVVGGASRWYNLQIVDSGTLVVDTIGSDVDTVMAIYTGATLFDLTLEASDDNGAPDGIRSLVRLPVTPGNYLVAVDTVGGVSGSILLNWQLGTAPQITAQPQAVSVSSGAPFELQVTAAGVPEPVYRWSRNGLPLAGAGGTVLRIPSAQLEDAGIYTVTVENFAGVRTSAEAEVTVQAANTAPLLLMPPNAVIPERAPWSATVLATDPDQPPNALTIRIESGPAGLEFSPASGELAWTPSEEQGPGTYLVRVSVADDGNPPLSATNTFSLTVTEENEAPVIEPIADLEIDEGAPMIVNAAATDGDVPVQALTFSLGEGAPDGAAIDSGTGRITWTPPPGSAPGSYPIAVIASDGGQQAMTAFTVTVVGGAPLMVDRASISLAGGVLRFSWQTVPGRRYQVQYKQQLTHADWIPLGNAMTASGTVLEISDPVAGALSRYYRVVKLD